MSIFLIVCILCFLSHAKGNNALKKLEDMSLEELMDIKIITVSLKEESQSDAPSNITIVTKQMIEKRGYKSLVEICEDIAGFDFLLYEEGGGEYTTYNKHRGIGDTGNSKILIMVDGIVQNFISFNWSTLWSHEHLLTDIERIEFISGPGSSIYGAQAYSGIIHFITKSRYEGLAANLSYGSNKSRAIEFQFGKKISRDYYFSIAFKKYNSDGDSGNKRYDPGNYFHNLVYPDFVTQTYGTDSTYLVNVPHPNAGENIPDGFQNWFNTYALRAKFTTPKSEIGFFLWDNKRANGSFIGAHAYDVTKEWHQAHFRGYHLYLKNSDKLSPKTTLKSNLVYRETSILPETGFSYTYRFPNLVKSYKAYSAQAYIEEILNYNFGPRGDFLVGIKLTASSKSPRTVSLDDQSANSSRTESSWDEANMGHGLGIPKDYSSIRVWEQAVYGLFNYQIMSKLSCSIGLRFDHSSEYGNILNPRLGLIYKLSPDLGFKLLYGTAFRQPSVFEMNDEFRGNPDLDPERIQTYEFETNYNLSNKMGFRFNIFYSKMTDFIDKISVPIDVKLSGQIYANISKYETRGISFYWNYQILENLSLYSNYMFLQGKGEFDTHWHDITHTARHKLNAGMNWMGFGKNLNVNLRMNYVGKRKAHPENVWINNHYDGYAPSYVKFHLAVMFLQFSKIKLQLSINNLFDTQYFGVGREDGSTDMDSYDPHILYNGKYKAAYHPQPGRTIMLSLKIDL